MRTLLLLSLGAALLCSAHAAQDNAPNAPAKSTAGEVTSHSQGLQGDIGFGHEKLPSQGGYTAGMGFYAAVWPLVDQPLADVQIGLPSSWIQPDNSDNQDTPLAPEGTLARKRKERGPTGSGVFQTVEGGLGSWAVNHVRYGLPTVWTWDTFPASRDRKKHRERTLSNLLNRFGSVHKTH